MIRRALPTLAVLALLAGCSTMRLGRAGGTASPTATQVTAKPSKRERAGAAPADPLAEARLRAAEEPTEPYWPYRAAELQAKAGHSGDAEASLRAAVARDSGYAPALSELSRTLYEQGRHEEAIRLLAPVRDGRVTMSSAERATVLAGLALHEAALGQDAAARETMAGASRDEAGVGAYLAVRGTDNESASKLTQAALHEARENAAAHNNRGIALLRTGDADAAEKEFQRAIELDPKRAAPYYNLAILERWYRLDTKAAAKRFQQYWSLSHADPDSLYAELGGGSPTPVAEQGTSK
jgi:tetratricopeptide (TPR) repeat protein